MTAPTRPHTVHPADAVDAATRLGDRLGHQFRDPSLLLEALAHRSWCAEQLDDVASNERLEYLGDSVLGLVVTAHTYVRYPELAESELSRLRAAVVSGEPLAEMARTVDVGAALLLGKGEDASGGRDKPSILADAVEAVIGAVYLDGGYAAAEELVLRLLADRIERVAHGSGGHDHKSRLQELTAQEKLRPPTYEVDADGPEHRRTFHAVVFVDGEVWGEGRGTTKKQAEQDAAEAALADRPDSVTTTPAGGTQRADRPEDPHG